MRNPDLWARLEAFEFDKGTGSAPFSVKLARAEGWSAAYTARVIEEYRRFLYLTQVSRKQVTPSQIVDAAWHMHLTFTRDYWEDLCPNVIGKPIHHQPCAGEEEMPRYRDQFAATKALYEAEFGAEPPRDIWGREDATRRKRRAFLIRDETGGASGVVTFVGVAGCVLLWFVAPDTHWLVYLLIIGLALWLESILEPPKRRKRRRSDDGGGYIDGGDGSSRGNGDSRGSSDKQSTGKGFFGLFDGDSGGDGGGCGGCGGGD